jgi:hypothetical protein
MHDACLCNQGAWIRRAKLGVVFETENIRMKAVLGLMGLAVVLCVSPLAGAKDLSGTWKGSFDFDGNSVPTALNLKVAGTDVTGTVEGLPTSPAEIHEGKVDGDNVTFWVNSDYQGTTYKLVFKGKVADDHVDFSFGTDDGSWGTTLTVKRDAPPAVPEPPKATDITGAWKGAFDLNGTSMPVVFNLKSAGAVVTGNAEGMGAAPIEIHDGKVDANTVTFWLNTDYQGQTYVLSYKGTLTSNQIDFSFGTSDGAWGSTISVKK